MTSAAYDLSNVPRQPYFDLIHFPVHYKAICSLVLFVLWSNTAFADSFPHFSRMDLKGERFLTADIFGDDVPVANRGAMVLIAFNVACHACIHEIPEIKKLRQAVAGKPIDFVYININVNDNEDDLREFAKEYKLDFPIVLDDDHSGFDALVAKLKFRRSFPVTFVVDRAGDIVGKPFVGETPLAELRNAVDQTVR